MHKPQPREAVKVDVEHAGPPVATTGLLARKLSAAMTYDRDTDDIETMTASPENAPLPADKLDLSISHSPQHTMYLRLSDAVASRRRDPRRRLIVASAEQAAALRPLQISRAHGYVPDAVVPIVDRTDITVGEQIAALHDYPEQTFTDDLEFIGTHNAAWATVADDPRRWLRAYAETIRMYWQRLEPRWRSAQHLIDREVERIGVASVRGGLDAALNTLSPRLRFTGDRFTFAGHCDISVRGRRVILVPSFIAPAATLIHENQPGVVSIAYSVPGQGAQSDRSAASGDDRLAVVVGAPRAAILRGLRTPMTMGEMARHIDLTPAATTRHCDRLERAGLIVRERRGQSVRVSVSARGEALRDLLT